MSRRLPLGRIAIGRRDELADGRFVLTSSPGCQHLFEISELSELEDEEPYEVVEDIDIIEPGDEPIEAPPRRVTSPA